jgi:hypothetical protein
MWREARRRTCREFYCNTASYSLKLGPKRSGARPKRHRLLGAPWCASLGDVRPGARQAHAIVSDWLLGHVFPAFIFGGGYARLGPAIRGRLIDQDRSQKGTMHALRPAVVFNMVRPAGGSTLQAVTIVRSASAKSSSPSTSSPSSPTSPV